ncbi:MAG: PD-(D/E)XK nuclease family protein [Candidatus Parvarchaeum sp.]
MNEEEIAVEVNKKFRDGIKDWMTSENSKREKSFHVSSFVYDCTRKVWYESKYDDKVPEPPDDGLFRMWIGTKLHETPVSESHEIPLRYNYMENWFTGRIDEIMEIDGKTFIIDKKFPQRLPRTANDHYLNQVMFYAALLKKTKGIVVDGVGIHYFTPTVAYEAHGEREKTFIRFVTPEEIDKYVEKIEQMMNEVITKLKNNTLPEKNVSWYCTYCPYKVSCDAESTAYMERN